MVADVPDQLAVPALISASDWQELAALFKQAEEALHDAETIHGDLMIPSVNQLRYAGHHMVNMMTCATQSDAKEEYRKARSHCQRAVYDAYDSAIAYLLKSVDQFKKDYAKIEITPYFPNYPMALKIAREARDLLVKARNGERGSYYAQCQGIFCELHNCYNQMEDAREELNKAIRTHNRSVMLAWSTLFITASGVIAAWLALR